MRVAIFFDGKNFYSGWKDRTDGRRIDFEKLSVWLVKEAGGTDLWGAYYYTSVESGAEAQSDGQRKLAAFLDERELDRGYFVKRFPRKAHTITCKSCGATDRIFAEKEVDTTMVADMLSLAAVSAFDVAVLVSGDADHAPAVEGVRSLGKKVLVATWAGYGLSPRIRRAAFHHIDLSKGLDAFGVLPSDGAPPAAPVEADRSEDVVGEATTRPSGDEIDHGASGEGWIEDEAATAGGVFGEETVSASDFSAGIDLGSPAAERCAGDALPDEHEREDEHEAEGEEDEPSTPHDAWAEATDPSPRLDADARLFLDELTRAVEKFRGGYVGLNFFLTRWKSPKMDASTDARRRTLDLLKEEGWVAVYEAPDGSKALRLGPRAAGFAERGNGS